MCGEHAPGMASVSWFQGSSPHVRGAHDLCRRPDSGEGIIPACAGSTLRVGRSVHVIWDHPRMCGEHGASTVEGVAVPGSSPHVRGARVYAIIPQPIRRIIPACAGSTRYIVDKRNWKRDHPRMCGEHRQ